VILVTTHQDADFDGAAGMLGATLLHPGAVAVFPGAKEAPLRRYLEQEPGVLPEVRMRDLALEEVRTLILVDTTAPERIGSLAPLMEPDSGIRVIAYDHHPESGARPGLELVCQPVGAVTTILVSLLRERGIRLTAAQATFMALGIYEDTGGLLHRGTRPEDLEAVSWLIREGAELVRIGSALARELTPEQVDLYHALLHEARPCVIRGREVVVAPLASERFVFDASVVVQQYLQATGMQRLVALVRMEDRIFAIIRSTVSDFNAAALGRRLGGGGHHHAASATIRGKTLIQLQGEVMSALREILEPPATAADVVTPILHWLPSDATIADGVAMLNRYRINGLPILEGDRVIGALTRQSADIALHHGMGPNPVKDLVSSEVDLVPMDADLEEVKEKLLAGNLRFILVGERLDRVQGLITRTALLRHVSEKEPGPEADFAAPRATKEPSTRQDCTPMMEKGLPGRAMKILRKVGDLAAEQEYQAFLVGGVVRDLLHMTPTRDLDVVVEGDACAIAKHLGRELGGKVRIHKAFQTAVVFLPGDIRLDLATARTEHYPTAGALPDVTPGSLKQDLFRRDFTINTLAVSLIPESFGRLLDYFGGRKDMTRGKIRVLHGLSFIEDPTRAIRAVRFALRLQFEISRETANLIHTARRSKAFRRLSPTRVRREIGMLFEESRLSRAVRALEEYDLLTVIHPRFRTDKKILDRLDRLDEAVAWYRMQEKGEDPTGWIMALSILSETLEEEERRKLWRKLAPGKRDLKVLQAAPAAVHRLIYTLAGHRRMRPSIVYRACQGLPLEILLLAIVSTRRPKVRRALTGFISDLRDIRPDIAGADLIHAGVREGPGISRGIDAALAAKLDGVAVGKRQQLAIAVEAAGKSGR
jgi:tRNA nucleotidyltransferase (CCA-adding enzyme)